MANFRNQTSTGAKLKGVQWTKIPPFLFAGTFFSTFNDLETIAQEIPYDVLEKEFALKEIKKKEEGEDAGKKRAGAGLGVLSSRNVQNLTILIRGFKKKNMELQDIIEAIRTMDETKLEPESVAEIIKWLPESEEVKRLTDLIVDTQPSPEVLDVAERFVLKINQIGMHREKLQVLGFKLSFRVRYGSLEGNIRLLEISCENLHKALSSGRTYQLFKYILLFGNFLNVGTNRKGFKGFKINGLTRVRELKTSDNKRTAVAVLCDFLDEKHPEICDFWGDLDGVFDASKLPNSMLSSELGTLSTDLKECLKSLDKVEHSAIADKEPFLGIMRPFAANAQDSLRELSDRYQGTKRSFTQLLKLIGEDTNSSTPMLPEELFTEVSNFIEDWKKYLFIKHPEKKEKKQAALTGDAAAAATEQAGEEDDIAKKRKNEEDQQEQQGLSFKLKSTRKGGDKKGADAGKGEGGDEGEEGGTPFKVKLRKAGDRKPTPQKKGGKGRKSSQQGDDDKPSFSKFGRSTRTKAGTAGTPVEDGKKKKKKKTVVKKKKKAEGGSGSTAKPKKKVVKKKKKGITAATVSGADSTTTGTKKKKGTGLRKAKSTQNLSVSAPPDSTDLSGEKKKKKKTTTAAAKSKNGSSTKGATTPKKLEKKAKSTLSVSMLPEMPSEAAARKKKKSPRASEAATSEGKKNKKKKAVTTVSTVRKTKSSSALVTKKPEKKSVEDGGKGSKAVKSSAEKKKKVGKVSRSKSSISPSSKAYAALSSSSSSSKIKSKSKSKDKSKKMPYLSASVTESVFEHGKPSPLMMSQPIVVVPSRGNDDDADVDGGRHHSHRHSHSHRSDASRKGKDEEKQQHHHHRHHRHHSHRHHDKHKHKHDRSHSHHSSPRNNAKPIGDRLEDDKRGSGSAVAAASAPRKITHKKSLSKGDLKKPKRTATDMPLEAVKKHRRTMSAVVPKKSTTIVADADDEPRRRRKRKDVSASSSKKKKGLDTAQRKKSWKIYEEEEKEKEKEEEETIEESASNSDSDSDSKLSEPSDTEPPPYLPPEGPSQDTLVSAGRGGDTGNALKMGMEKSSSSGIKRVSKSKSLFSSIFRRDKEKSARKEEKRRAKKEAKRRKRKEKKERKARRKEEKRELKRVKRAETERKHEAKKLSATMSALGTYSVPVSTDAAPHTMAAVDNHYPTTPDAASSSSSSSSSSAVPAVTTIEPNTITAANSNSGGEGGEKSPRTLSSPKKKTKSKVVVVKPNDDDDDEGDATATSTENEAKTTGSSGLSKSVRFNTSLEVNDLGSSSSSPHGTPRDNSDKPLKGILKPSKKEHTKMK